MVLLGVKRICPTCGHVFFYCQHCWRGSKYCSPECSLLGRRKNRRATEKKYASTAKGKESRRRRQKIFRIRRILGLKVTDHSSLKLNPGIISLSKQSNGPFPKCCCCKRTLILVDGVHFEGQKENKYFSFRCVKTKTNREQDKENEKLQMESKTQTIASYRKA